ncbi:MAG: helix-turn-helix domain-containing protein [Dehalococcoidia bacterium]
MGGATLAPTVHESELGYWEMVPRAPSPEVSGFVARIDGYVQNAEPARHRQLPSGRMPFIISIGDPLQGAPAHEDELRPYQGFVAGLHDSYATTEFGRANSGVQIDLSPLGMRMLLGGIPMHELTNRMVHLEDVAGAEGRELVEQLQEEPDWDGRFDRMEAFIANRLRVAPEPAEDVAYAWHRLTQTVGCMSIGGLADEIGYSRKQLIARFRDHIGMPPKLAARILRFQHARELLNSADDSNWSDIAFDAGYYDQSHLIRDFVEFSGSSPTDYVARLLPDSGGMRGD